MFIKANKSGSIEILCVAQICPKTKVNSINTKIEYNVQMGAHLRTTSSFRTHTLCWWIFFFVVSLLNKKHLVDIQNTIFNIVHSIYIVSNSFGRKWDFEESHYSFLRHSVESYSLLKLLCMNGQIMILHVCKTDCYASILE